MENEATGTRTHFLLHRSTMGSGFSQPATATMTPAYLVVALCVAANMPGPARAAALTLLRSLRTTGTVHDWMIPDSSTPRCFRKDEHGETLLSRMAVLFKEVGVISSPSTLRGARLWTSPRQHRDSSRLMEHSIFMQTTIWWLRHSI